MDIRDKLIKLVPHWQEHREHAESYKRWAGEAENEGNAKIADILNRLYEESIKPESLFKEPQGVLLALTTTGKHPKKIQLIGSTIFKLVILMNKTICKRVATVKFWDDYAEWYKRWMEHNRYHDRIIEVLTTMVSLGWKVLDIGAGNGILSLPLCAVGCEVTALEPSTAMRSLLYEESFKRGIDWINVDDRRWEEVSAFEYKDYDLIIACNTLHLTRTGFSNALQKVFRTGSKNVFLITEKVPGTRIKWQHENYRMLFGKFYETESSFYYHDFQEAYEHWSFKKGRRPYPDEAMNIRSQVVFEDDRLLIKDTACVGMYWWKRQGIEIKTGGDEREHLTI